MQEVEVVSRSKIVQDSFSRPANTTLYTAGDVVADSTTQARVLKFENIARKIGRGGIINAATLVDNTAESTKPDLELYLFSDQPVMEQDNAAWAPADSEMETCE